MIRLWHILVFALALLVFAIARAPIALVASRVDTLAYERADGTIWQARLSGVRLAGLDAGEATWTLSLVGLLNGKFVAAVTLDGRDVKGQAQLLGNLQGDRRIVIPTLALSGANLGPGFQLAGETQLANVDLFFRRGQCATALGEGKSDVLTRNQALLRWEGPALAGTAQCEGAWAQLPLIGGGNEERVIVALGFRGDGAGEWQVRVETAREGALAALAAAGLAPDPRGGISKSATWRWFPF